MTYETHQQSMLYFREEMGDENVAVLIVSAFSRLGGICRGISAANGFWNSPRNKGEMIALMHSELSEMLEGVRKPGPDSHCPQFTKEEIELADVLIRAFDYADGFGLRLAQAMLAKMAYNTTRPYKHNKEF